ncbi:hypothetical protein M2404_001492 [Rheinheimera pacifica]|uniref:hypothetical protein n=1 Tax=Rheinheimera pacifica TaxID=173990 RepID=UPI00216751AB|nr:hypothetical protein [Rheinheimera pacifica]MCS4307165.1 hypothetical protein [Rheinheimera pacifica]
MRALFLNSTSVGLLFSLLTACGSGGNTTNEQGGVVTPPPVVISPPPVNEMLPIPDNRYADQYQILLVGNSHVRSNNLSSVLSALLEQGTGKTTITTIAPGGAYLDERLSDGVTLAALQSHNWSHVIWQAQKYSTTGQYSYSTAASEYWVGLTKQLAATPIMFPEHPRRGNAEEGMRVYLLHLGIAEREASCVAPVGPAWDNAIAMLPQTSFHSDGNHASLAGTLLTALVFYEIISGESADELPYMPEIALAEQLQAQLRQVASATLQQYSGCTY